MAQGLDRYSARMRNQNQYLPTALLMLPTIPNMRRKEKGLSVTLALSLTQEDSSIIKVLFIWRSKLLSNR